MEETSPITANCLEEAINGESTAVQKYKLFRNKALEEGYKNIAYFYRVLISAEKIHIKNHKKALGKADYVPKIGEIQVGTTLENIKASIIGEMHETKKMYPQMLKKTKKEMKEEPAKVARLSMIWAKQAERVHARMLTNILKEFLEGREMEIESLYVCPFCGNLELTKIEVCEVCKHDGLFLRKIERREEEKEEE